MKHRMKTALAALGLAALTACQSPLNETPGSSGAAARLLAGFSGDVTLQAQANGRFVSADLDLGGRLVADRAAAQGWETFTLVPQAGGKYALQAKANGKFVSADLTKAGALVADRTAVQGWELFTLEPKGGDSYALRAEANGQYVCADLGQSAKLAADRAVAQGWETFTIVPAGTVNPPSGWTWPGVSGTWLNGSQTVSPVDHQASAAWAGLTPPMAGMKVVNNTWGIPDNGTGSVAVFDETVHGAYTFGWAWNLTPKASNQVIAYPEIGWGWSPNASDWFNGPTPLHRISDNKSYKVDFNIKRTNRSGIWNTAFDIWIYPMDKPTGGSGGFKGGYELMIWLDHEVQGPWGSNPQYGVNLAGSTWTAYSNDGSAGWKVLTYIKEGAGLNDARDFDLTAFLNDVVSRYGVPRTHFINAVEFGSESCGGQGMLEVANYQLKVQ